MWQDQTIVQIIYRWFRRNFSDPQALGLMFTAALLIAILTCLGHVLLPAIVSMILAYLLTPAVRLLQRWRLPHGLAVAIVFALFVGLFILVLFAFLPYLWRQMVGLVDYMPAAMSKSQVWINHLAEKFPRLIPANPLEHMALFLKAQSARIGQLVFSISYATLPGLVEAVLYLVLVPLLVFFFMKDHVNITHALSRFLPSHRGLLRSVWHELRNKIAAYIRARMIEMVIVGLVATVLFLIFGLPFAVLMGVIVGLSVIVPYVGAVVATIPVVILGVISWGMTSHFLVMLICYALLIGLDANLLVPLLFSESLDLHPIVVILSVLVFGGLWGFWGVFFAIPLAALIKIILTAWPQVAVESELTS